MSDLDAFVVVGEVGSLFSIGCTVFCSCGDDITWAVIRTSDVDVVVLVVVVVVVVVGVGAAIGMAVVSISVVIVAVAAGVVSTNGSVCISMTS